jgi:hypothetical protein
MDNRELLNRLLAAEKVEEVKAAISECRQLPNVDLVPFGRRDNNRGAIEVATDPARSAIERVTNAHDAILEYEHDQHGGVPKSNSPREAAAHWLGVPTKGGLSALSPGKRQELAADTVVRLEPGEGWQSRLLTVIDRGTGIAPDQMEGTILSLNESNKIQKHYLAGTYGQGGSSTLVFSRYVLLASRAASTDEIAFTVVWYQDLPADQYKTGRYVYLTRDGALPVAKADAEDIERGTIIKHFGYDLSGYTSSIGPKSLYGALQRVLFDPVAPIRFENQVHNWNRTIKGARNALNGAVDDGDDGDEGSGKGPEIDYRLPTFNVSLGDHGEIGVEYWVLARKFRKDGKPSTEAPSRAFVDNTKPIVLTHNGQNQGEISGRLVQKDADLFYLQKQGRLIVHVNCDRLSPQAKRMLFSSTREQWREGFIQNTIQEEIVSLLKSDDELRRLNEMARDESLRDKDDAAEKQIQRQVARLLRITGPAIAEVGGTSSSTAGDDKPGGGGGGSKTPEPIEPSDPPTFIRIVTDEDKPIKFYGGQRRMIRLETDANSDYHDPDDPAKNRLNIIVGNDLEVYATSPISGGRFRIGVRAKTEVAIGSSGSIRVELYRPGATTLSDERNYSIVEQPKPKEGQKKNPFPQFRFEPVGGPDDDNWLYLVRDADDKDVRKYASAAEMTSEGLLIVYYSTAFPRFANERRKLEQSSPAMAQSFEQRYKLWLAVHALLKHEDEEAATEQMEDEDLAAEMSRQERCRLASMAAMMAAQEVKSGISESDEEDAAVA